MEEMSFTVNSYGIPIKRCCASCRSCKLDKSCRYCIIGRRTVGSSDVCGLWAMKEALNNAGKGDGNIKSRGYLMYAVDRLCEDEAASAIAAHERTQHERITTEEIRKRYRENTKMDIYTKDF